MNSRRGGWAENEEETRPNRELAQALKGETAGRDAPSGEPHPNRFATAVVELPSDREIVITRLFDAPARLVFEVWTTPAYLRRWWSIEPAPLIVCDIDLRVGGRWRYVSRDGAGVELGWSGVYRDIVAGERIVASEVFEGYPDAEAVNTLTLSEQGGVTTLAVHVLHRSKENRDGHVRSGMEASMQLAMNRLESLLNAPETNNEEHEK